jgi:hypothetical protein
MIKFLHALILMAALSSQAGSTWTLWFEMPTNGIPTGMTNYVPGTNQAYYVAGTTNLVANPTNFTLLTVWTNWAIDASVVPNLYVNSVDVADDAQWFFTVGITNMWGNGSPLSTPVTTGPLWSPVQSRRLKRSK